MKILLKQDSRDQHYPLTFGQTIPEEFPLEINFDSIIQDYIQPPGNIECVCISTCDIATDEDKVQYDFDDLFNRVSHSQFGTDPREVLSKVTSQKADGGLLPVGQTIRTKKWNSYWRADTSNTGLIDQFDTVRSTMLRTDSSVACGTAWFANWPSGQVLPIGQNQVSNHMWVIEGWKQVNGQPVFIVEAWVGRKLYMPRDVFNDAMKSYGAQAWVLSTSEVFERVKISWLQKIVDLCVNTISLLKQLLIVKQSEIDTQVIVNKPKYDWSTPILTRHSVRVICDEQHLDVSEKNLICAVIQAESGFDTKAIGKLNKDGTRDYGLCQYNTGKNKKGVPYWIGEGAAFKDIDEVLNNPEKNVRVMIATFKAGHIDYWDGYNNGSYKKYL